MGGEVGAGGLSGDLEIAGDLLLRPGGRGRGPDIGQFHEVVDEPFAELGRVAPVLYGT